MRQLSTRDQNVTEINNYRSPYIDCLSAFRWVDYCDLYLNIMHSIKQQYYCHPKQHFVIIMLKLLTRSDIFQKIIFICATYSGESHTEFITVCLKSKKTSFYYECILYQNIFFTGFVITIATR